MKNGKLDIKKKTDYVSPAEAFGGGDLEVEKAILDHFAEKGLAYKWLSIRTLKARGGSHPTGWKVFTLPEGFKRPQNLFGTSPDGTIVVGDLVLGYKPLKGPGVTVENHKKVLAQRVADRTKQAMGSGKSAIRIEEDDND